MRPVYAHSRHRTLDTLGARYLRRDLPRHPYATAATTRHCTPLLCTHAKISAKQHVHLCTSRPLAEMHHASTVHVLSSKFATNARISASAREERMSVFFTANFDPQISLRDRKFRRDFDTLAINLDRKSLKISIPHYQYHRSVVAWSVLCQKRDANPAKLRS